MTGSTPQQLAALALEHHKAGRLAEAEAAYRRVLGLAPPPGPAATLQFNLATLLRDGGRLEEAASHYTEAARINPANPKAHGNLGAVLEQLGRLDEARASLGRAVALDPSYAHAHYNLGNVLRRLDRPAEAADAYARAIALNPRDADAHDNLGVSLEMLGCFEDALLAHDRALAIDPNLASAHFNRGNVLAAMGREAEAEASYRRAIAADAAHAEARNNLGRLLAEQGLADQALALHEAAAALKPDYADARWNAALIRLVQGDFTAGWPGYEWRLRLKGFGPRFGERPRWDGGDLGGRTLLLHAEQGAGDSIQFIRYAALAKARGARVILESPPELTRLLTTAAGIDRLIVQGDPLPDFDVHAPLPSLPGLFGSIPAATPYLAADGGQIEAWRKRLSRRQGVKVGLIWRGNSGHARDRIRSMPAETMAGLLEAQGVDWLSLQRDATAEELTVLAGAEPLGEELSDWADTAAVLEALDLVVTVDTAMAHLAGALARPTLLLLPFVPDWRWLEDRQDSPWHPTLRLVRQPSRGDWDSVIAEAKRQIAVLV